MKKTRAQKIELESKRGESGLEEMEGEEGEEEESLERFLDSGNRSRGSGWGRRGSSLGSCQSHWGCKTMRRKEEGKWRYGWFW